MCLANVAIQRIDSLREKVFFQLVCNAIIVSCETKLLKLASIMHYYRSHIDTHKSVTRNVSSFSNCVLFYRTKRSIIKLRMSLPLVTCSGYSVSTGDQLYRNNCNRAILQKILHLKVDFFLSSFVVVLRIVCKIHVLACSILLI